MTSLELHHLLGESSITMLKTTVAYTDFQELPLVQMLCEA